MNATALGEVLQDRGGIVADGRQGQALFPESFFVLFQLDQLGFAVWSPIGGSDKDEHQSLLAHQGLDRLLLAGLILQGERRHGRSLPDAGIGRCELGRN